MQTGVFQKIFKVFAWIFGVLLVLILLLFTRVDRRDYQTMDYYQETMGLLDSMSLGITEGEFWQVGWAKVNATPDEPVKLAGYRPRGKYQFVQDSSYLRALVLQNGEMKLAVLNYELMIISPRLKRVIEKQINEANLPIDHLTFTATHTHSGIGGYIPGIPGKFGFGGYSKNTVDFLTERTIEALQKALQDLDTCRIFFSKTQAAEMVANRLIKDDPIDPYIRKIDFEKSNGQKGTFLTYSAHPTIMNAKFMGLSGDYPHYLSETLEANGYDFSLFAAGTVGSHRPIAEGNQPENVSDYGVSLAYHLIESQTGSTEIESVKLSGKRFPLALRKAHFRITQNSRIRPWVFSAIIGDPNAHFDVILIGNLLWLTSSGEISGTMMQGWQDYAASNNLELMITCFNGGYIGYITPDEYYDLPLYETKDMNWFGPQNGAYFDEIIKKLIDRSSELQ